MVVTGCLSPSDGDDAVTRNVVFLLAGVIPLGLALEATDDATAFAEEIVATDAPSRSWR